MSVQRFKAVQTTLNRVCNAGLTVDGKYGRNTHNANISALQKLSGNKPKSKSKPVAVSSASNDDMPSWLEKATDMMGLHESRNYGQLSRFLKIGTYLGDPRRLPWCGDFVESCFKAVLPAEVIQKSPFWAQSWKNFGIKLDEPAVGAVGVIRWTARTGHVGFIVDWNSTHIKLRGGNQANAVNDKWFPRSKFIAYTWPKSVPFKEYARIRGSAGKAGYAGTR